MGAIGIVKPGVETQCNNLLANRACSPRKEPTGLLQHRGTYTSQTHATSTHFHIFPLFLCSLFFKLQLILSTLIIVIVL